MARTGFYNHSWILETMKHMLMPQFHALKKSFDFGLKPCSYHIDKTRSKKWSSTLISNSSKTRFTLKTEKNFLGLKRHFQLKTSSSPQKSHCYLSLSLCCQMFQDYVRRWIQLFVIFFTLSRPSGNHFCTFPSKIVENMAHKSWAGYRSTNFFPRKRKLG